MTDRSERNEELAALSVLVIIIILLAIFTFHDIRTKKKVSEDYGITTGWIVSYFDSNRSVEGSGRTIKYEYVVDSVTYSRQIHTLNSIAACKNFTNPDCRSMRFMVIYQRSDHRNSLINFEIEEKEMASYKIKPSDFQ